jgi:hypothetical protein
MLTKAFTAARVQQNKHVAGVGVERRTAEPWKKEIACLALTDALGQANSYSATPPLVLRHPEDGHSCCISTIQQQFTALEREKHSIATV